jgi:hypothetical protein
LASVNVAVEQKSNVSAISCPTSNIACRNRHTYRKRRKIVRSMLSIREKLSKKLYEPVEKKYLLRTKKMKPVVIFFEN